MYETFNIIMSPKRNKGSALEDQGFKGKPKSSDKTLKFGAYLMFELDQQNFKSSII